MLIINIDEEIVGNLTPNQNQFVTDLIAAKQLLEDCISKLKRAYFAEKSKDAEKEIQVIMKLVEHLKQIVDSFSSGTGE